MLGKRKLKIPQPLTQKKSAYEKNFYIEFGELFRPSVCFKDRGTYFILQWLKFYVFLILQRNAKIFETVVTLRIFHYK